MGMGYGLLDLLNLDEPGFCVVDELPTGTGLDRVDAARPARGEHASHIYPPDARVKMSSKFGGMELADFVSNTRGLLIVHKRVKEVIESINSGPTEFLPLAIFNHKGRLASADYYVVNPLGTWDVLDLNASDIQWSDGDVVALREIVLDREKMRNAPDLFRLKEDTSWYLISKRIASRLRELDPPNTNRNYRDFFEL
jgi:hypothetical protein